MDALLAIVSGFAAACMVRSGDPLVVLLDDALVDSGPAAAGKSFLQPPNTIVIDTIIMALQMTMFTKVAPA